MQDVDRAIAVTVESFVGAQKVSCKKALARAFAKYVFFFLFLFLEFVLGVLIFAGVGTVWDCKLMVRILGIHSRTRIRNLGMRPGEELRGVVVGLRLLWLEAY